jgi:uncharacterized protein (DUF1778 family)
MAATARVDLRVKPETKATIERAAALLGEPVSEFVRTTVEQRAAQVIAEHDAYTRVPSEFFDELLDALQSPPAPAPALIRAARRARTTVTRV